MHWAPYLRRPRLPVQSMSSAPRPQPAYLLAVISRCAYTARSARSQADADHTARLALAVTVMVAARIALPQTISQTTHVAASSRARRTLASRCFLSGHGLDHWSVSLDG